jgi:hypothetical protein
MLVYPDQCTDLNCVMEYGAHKYVGPDGLSFVTRNIKGKLPAATLRARAGDTLRITLTNLLQDKNNVDGDVGTFRLPNTTNVHTVRDVGVFLLFPFFLQNMHTKFDVCVNRKIKNCQQIYSYIFGLLN